MDKEKEELRRKYEEACKTVEKLSREIFGLKTTIRNLQKKFSYLLRLYLKKITTSTIKIRKENKMAKYRKKPVVIDAIKYDKQHIGRLLNFCGVLEYNPHDNEYYVKTLEGCMKVSDGDYIIKGVNGEFYPCKADIFEKTYEEVM